MEDRRAEASPPLGDNVCWAQDLGVPCLAPAAKQSQFAYNGEIKIMAWCSTHAPRNLVK
jgi:hypothetical protein